MKNQIKEALERDEELRNKFLLHLWKKQTGTEQARGRSSEHNGVGFDRHDASKFSSIARKLSNNWQLADWERDYLERRLPRYWRQLPEDMIPLEKVVAEVQQEVAKEVKPVQLSIRFDFDLKRLNH